MRKVDFGEIIQDVEIMRAGTHTASSGQQVTFTEEDLAELAERYDPAFHESPVVIGHPENNQPAYGWVRSLRAAGGRLLATLDLVPEFVDAVRQGLFKKRSASIYNDLDGKGAYLRHVGFLGAMPPAVKALADINLEDGKKSHIFEFAAKERIMSWKDKVKGLFTQAVDEIPDETSQGAARVVMQWPDPPRAGAASFSEEDVRKREQAAAEAAAKKAREEAETSFAEQKKTWEAEQAARARSTEIRAKFDGLVAQGKVAPAWMKAGIVDFAEQLGGTDTLEFGESGRKTPHQWFLDFLEGLPKLIELGEIADRSNEVGRGGAGQKLEAITQKKLSEDRGKGYAQAFAEAQREHPDLAREYAEEIRS